MSINLSDKPADSFSQTNYLVRLEWGHYGARIAAARGDVVIIIDTLSFSTAVVTAVHYGGIVYPCRNEEELDRIAVQMRGIAKSVSRQDVPDRGLYSLSSETYFDLEPETRIALMSPNGAACFHNAQKAPKLYIGSLLNADAIGNVIARILDETDLAVTLNPCGERWSKPNEDGSLRFAVEDCLAAGAILSYVTHDKSPEAMLCEAAYNGAQNYLEEIIWECVSGLELRNGGFDNDVSYAAQMNIYDTVVVRDGECLVKDET